MFVHTDTNGIRRKFVNAKAARRFMREQSKLLGGTAEAYKPDHCPDDAINSQVFDHRTRTGHDGARVGSTQRGFEKPGSGQQRRKLEGSRNRWQKT